MGWLGTGPGPGTWCGGWAETGAGIRGNGGRTFPLLLITCPPKYEKSELYLQRTLDCTVSCTLTKFENKFTYNKNNQLAYKFSKGHISCYGILLHNIFFCD